MPWFFLTPIASWARGCHFDDSRRTGLPRADRRALNLPMWFC
jgi:hypothetical protein